MMMTRIRRYTKSIPRRYTIMRELALATVLFESFKRELQASVKVLLRDVLQLRLRIVNVINIDTLHTHVSQRLLKLVLQVRRRHAVTANDVSKRSNPRLYESLIYIVAHVLRRRAVERQVAAFGANDELFAGDAVLVCEYLQRFANGPFASLKTIVRGGVDEVDAKLHCANDRVRVV